MVINRPSEESVLTEDVVRTAANSLLADSMIRNGYIEIGAMSRVELDYAVHILRRYRATKFGRTFDVI